jgi:hypothetical protein
MMGVERGGLYMLVGVVRRVGGVVACYMAEGDELPESLLGGLRFNELRKYGFSLHLSARVWLQSKQGSQIGRKTKPQTPKL